MIPWARASDGMNSFSYFTSIAYSVLLTLDQSNTTGLIIVLIIIVALEVINLGILWLTIPYYSQYVEGLHIGKSTILGYIYFFTLMKTFLGIQENKIAFNLLVAFSLILLIYTIISLKAKHQQSRFLLAGRKKKELKIQLIEII
jgi:hypothetical protein